MKSTTTTASPHRRLGFTLLEVMLAMTIFAIVSAALFVTFQRGIKTWQTAHSASEMFQTARIAQDVLLRDLHNVAYITEKDYNTGFRGQLDQLAGMFGGAWTETTQMPSFLPPMGDQAPLPGEFYDESRLFSDLGSVTPPIDLSFHGENGEVHDTLSFARFLRPRSETDPNVSGFQRIKYFVSEGILYREESSHYGFRPGDHFDVAVQDGSMAEKLSKLFRSPGGKEPEEEVYLDEEKQQLLPDVMTATAEPLCIGVEIFNISYGYYRFDQWNEVDDWDSNQFRYRFPLDELLPPGAQDVAGALPPVESSFAPMRDPRRAQMAMGRGQMMRFQPLPDNLPGYVAIQLGLRDPSGKGRLRSFTFFVSMPMAREEFDTTLVEDTGRSDFLSPTVPSQSPNRGKLFTD